MDFFYFLIEPYRDKSFLHILLESIAATSGVVSVFFSIKKNILVYPSGIVGTAIYIYIYFTVGFFGDMTLNFYYTVMSIYGWILWDKNLTRKDMEVLRMTKKDVIPVLVLFILGLILVVPLYYFKPFIDNGFSMNGIVFGMHGLDWANYLDIFTTSLFIIGMWLMAKRKLENWLFFILADIISIPMMFYKKIPITGILMIIFTFMAFIGLIKWSKNVKK